MKTFKSGGVHPPQNKELTRNSAIINAHIPHKVIIPLLQHFGKVAKPVVKQADIVQEGQLIGSADGNVSANVHSSIPGKVVDIDYYPTVLSERTFSVVIEFSGQMRFSQSTKVMNNNIDKNTILEKIKNAGIVGLGGAMFPTTVKLKPAVKIDNLIINGAECEPYLTSDYRLMLERTDEILQGIEIIKKVLDVKKCFIGIEINKKDAIKKFKNNSIEVVPLKTRYPQGGEKQLIYAILKKEVPSGGLPFDVGCIVLNVATVFAIKEAVVDDKPLIERVVTITGKIVKKPGNYKIRIGTLISDLVDDFGGFKKEPAKIIFGGPMMGIAVSSMDIPVIKGTSGIIFQAEDEIRDEKFYDCIRCGKCVSACVMRLNPSHLSVLGEKERWQDMKENNVLDCIECGCCSYSCPSNRPIVQFIKQAKATLK